MYIHAIPKMGHELFQSNKNRMCNLEGQNSGVIIIDVQGQSTMRIIAIYRIFNPPGNISQHDYFTTQLQLIKTAIMQKGNKRVVILGDFNLNEVMKYNVDYSHKSYYDEIK